MTDKMKNILIGVFVAAALLVAISLILFLKPTVGDGKKILHVRFTNIAGISIGTRVSFAGKPVGEVTKIEEIHDVRSQPSDETGRIYFYELTLKVDSTVEIFSSDEIAIRTTGLMGEKSIAIIPKSPPQGVTAKLITGQVIYASSIDPLENTFNQMAKVATRVQTAVDNFDSWFEENRAVLTAAAQSFNATMNEAATMLASVNQEGLVTSIREATDLLSDNLRLIRSSLDEDQLLHKAAVLMGDLDQAVSVFNTDGAETLHNLQRITRDIANGTGTLGRLINSDDFYLRLSSVLSKAETTMNDINHYGVLFQYDKGWQRSRTKRANLLKALDSPNDFRTYFEGEVDTIQTSLGRLTELLERAEDSDEREKILQSECFKRDFASLLRQIQALNDSVRLYNQELVSKSECP